MISPKEFYILLKNHNIDFFSGVPDSLLKDICAYITDNTIPKRNIITANEGGAIALACGYHLATNNIPMVYMQNSGIGNAVNPLLSLVDKEVYNIPILLLIGWRGEPGIKDEPQHIKQGAITLELFKTMGISYDILPKNIEDANKCLQKSIQYMKKTNSPLALIVKKNTFDSYKLKKIDKTNFDMSREDALKIIIDNLSDNDIVVTTTGKTSRELFEYRKAKGQSNKRDFLTVGSMGHANQIALGIALEKPDRMVYCIDGDGAVFMHTGSLGIIGDLKPSNFRHIVINNGAHDSVGGQKTIGFKVNISKIAEVFKYTETYKVTCKIDLEKNLKKIKKNVGLVLTEILVNKGARENLGRPTVSPLQNKESFKIFLKK